jgi:hypothetical protein
MSPATETSLQLRVDFLPTSALALPGRLGLTRAPGRWWPGRSTDSERRLRDDIRTIAEDYGARALVTLLERMEISELGNIGREARRARLDWIHFPIPDMWVPSDIGSARKLVRRMIGMLERGDTVVVHCWGGLGRAGTIAACCLVEQGVEPARAIALVRSARPRAVQTDAQEHFVRDWSAGA